MKKWKFQEFKLDASTRIIHHPFICMDVENNPRTGEFICACLYGKYKNHHGKEIEVEETFTDRFELMERLKQIAKAGGKKNIPFYLGLFNAEYDLYYIRELVNDYSRIEVNGRLITARLNIGGKRGIPVMDATNHVRGSLENWIYFLKMDEKYGIQKLSLDNLQERCMMDTKATYYLFNWLEDMYHDEFKINMKFTVGSCAREYFRKYFQKENFIRNNQFLNDFERKAYRGGRVEVFIRGRQKVKAYDINSMYISIMKDALIPIPQSAQYSKDVHSYDINTLSIIHCKVHVPEQIIAPLPYYDEQTKKLIFPIGTFDGYWTNVELKNAMRYGAKILEIYDYIYYKRADYIFRDFAITIWKKRQEHKSAGNADLDYLYKTIGNSLYGKFGEQHSKSTWIRIDDDTDDLENAEVKEWMGNKYIFQSQPKEDSKHTFPCIPVFITSYARIKLLNTMKEIGEENVVYCDTDSNHILAKSKCQIKSSTDLGDFKYEYTKRQTYYRPKMYGEKKKGVPKKARISHIKAKNKLRFRYRKPTKRKESIRRGLSQNKWIKVRKEISLEDDKRVWYGNKSLPIRLK